MEREDLFDKVEGYDKVCIQAPSGLKKEALDLSRDLKEKNKRTVIMSEPCFGACDLADRKAEFLGCDCLIHMGHSPFYKNGEKLNEEIPVFYLEKELDWDISKVLRKEIEKIEEEKIGIVSTVQHLHKLQETKKTLEDLGKKALIGDKGVRTQQKGQILGCDATSAGKIKEEVDAFLVLGSGKFHALRVLETGKKVYRLDPMEERIEKLEPERVEKEERKRISKALKYKEEKTWGIIESTKKGQHHPEVVKNVKEKLESVGKEVFVMAGDRVLEEDLVDFGIKVWINTACPRLTDDFRQVAVINPDQIQYLE